MDFYDILRSSDKVKSFLSHFWNFHFENWDASILRQMLLYASLLKFLVIIICWNIKGWTKRMKGKVCRRYSVYWEFRNIINWYQLVDNYSTTKNLLPVDGTKKFQDTILWRVHLRNKKIGFSIWRNKNEKLKWDISPKIAFFVIFAYLMDLLRC